MRFLPGAMGLAVMLVTGCSRKESPVPSSQSLPGLQVGDAPWPRELGSLTERLNAIGLPAMPAESFVLHIHQLLAISIRGRGVQVPAGIGIHEQAGYISPLHTHDTTGTIHIEAPNQGPFNLGQFFDVWGLRLTAECIGGYCTAGTDSLRVSSNGVRVEGDPRSLLLADQQRIDITFGPRPEGAPR